MRGPCVRQIEAKGSIHGAFEKVRAETGLELPGGDLLYADAYPSLMIDVESGVYWGTTFVGGVECHYLSFCAKEVDWQIWDPNRRQAAPDQYVLTTKWMTGALQYA